LFWKNKFGLFSADQVEVKLKFSKEISHHIEGRTWHHSQEIVKEKNGDVILLMKVGLSPELVSWILGWHKHVTVQSPDELIDIIKSSHREALEKYN
jgi:predicted DNA-binding transcriptional regulator YafY